MVELKKHNNCRLVCTLLEKPNEKSTFPGVLCNRYVFLDYDDPQPQNASHVKRIDLRNYSCTWIPNPMPVPHFGKGIVSAGEVGSWSPTTLTANLETSMLNSGTQYTSENN